MEATPEAPAPRYSIPFVPMGREQVRTVAARTIKCPECKRRPFEPCQRDGCLRGRP